MGQRFGGAGFHFDPNGPSSVPPVLDLDISNAPNHPLVLQEWATEFRKDAALQVVESHDPRIANTVRSLWGYKEYSAYMNKLIMNGGDGMGRARIGFNPDAVPVYLRAKK